MGGRLLQHGLLSLPPGWKVEMDTASGREYYAEAVSGAPLPRGWCPIIDPSTGLTIFKNLNSKPPGQTQRFQPLPPPATPSPLPSGWSQHSDPYGRVYYLHAATNTSQWTQPPHPPAPPPPPPAVPVPAFSAAAYNIEGLLFEVGDWSLEANLDALRRAQPGGHDWPDLIALTEVPVCPSDAKDCAACGTGRALACSAHVGATVQAILTREGFEGAMYLSSKRKGDDAADLKNSVGAFFRRDVFQYAFGTDGRAGKALFVDLGGKFGVGISTKKGFVLLPLVHLASGALLLFVALHTSVPMDAGAFNPDAQRGEIDQLESKVQSVLENYPGMSVVLAGDFNARGCAASGQQPDAFDRAVTTHGYRSAYCEVLGHEPRYTSVAEAFKHTIDYCLFRNGGGRRGAGRALVPVGVWDVDDVGGATVFQPLAHKVKGRSQVRESSRPSDHLPVAAVFALL